MSVTVSVVTVCLNDARGLERTIDSVRRQTGVERELLVVDGGSTDGSVDVLRRSADAVTWWTSERDGGVFEAQNKGARQATGNWLVFLNAGDRFASDDALSLALRRADGADVLYGDVVWEMPSGELRESRQPDQLTLDFFMGTALPHQATAVRRQLFERLGPFDTSFRIAADHAFFLKSIVMHGARTKHVPVPLAIQAYGGLSTCDASFASLRHERQRAKREMLSPIVLAHWEAYLQARRGSIMYRLRNAFRPLGRRLRSLSRRVRHRPDCYV